MIIPVLANGSLLLDAESVIFDDIGLDWITVAYPANGFDMSALDPRLWTTDNVKRNARYRETNLGVRSLRITLTDTRQGESEVRIDLTPAYVLGRQTNVLVPIDDVAPRLITSAMRHVDDEFGFGMPMSKQDVRVTRIDVVRNLMFANTSDIDPFFRGHQDRRPKWARKNQTHTGKGGTTGVDKGGKRRSVSIYDKYVESGGGHVTQESFVGKQGLERVPSETSELLLCRISPPLRLRVHAPPCGIGREWANRFESGAASLEKLKQKMDSGEADLGDAKAVLHEVFLGGHGASPSTRDRAQRIIRRLGLSAHMGRDEVDLRHFLTADYVTGHVTRI